MKKTLLIVFSGVLFALLSSPGMSQQLSDYVNVRIINDSRDELRVSVYDNVCGVMLLEKRLVRNGEIDAQLCTQGMDKGDVTIRNLETGAVRRYQNVVGGTKLAAPY